MICLPLCRVFLRIDLTVFLSDAVKRMITHRGTVLIQLAYNDGRSPVVDDLFEVDRDETGQGVPHEYEGRDPTPGLLQVPQVTVRGRPQVLDEILDVSFSRTLRSGQMDEMVAPRRTSDL